MVEWERGKGEEKKRKGKKSLKRSKEGKGIVQSEGGRGGKARLVSDYFQSSGIFMYCTYVHMYIYVCLYDKLGMVQVPFRNRLVDSK